MPQASDELRAKFPGWDREASAVLAEAGYSPNTETWIFTLPRHGHVITARELDALSFLCDEFDYGGWEEPERTRSDDAT